LPTRAKATGPTRNDLKPASIGVHGATVRVGGLKLWRDTYYTVDPMRADYEIDPLRPDARQPPPDWGDPESWQGLRELAARTLYVQPGHYLCLGDNSTASSDGRSWGLVPERLMLGRALLVYYPFYAPFWPLNTPVNRVGTIK
jgi:signal peptidase I